MSGSAYKSSHASPIPQKRPLESSNSSSPLKDGKRRRATQTPDTASGDAGDGPATQLAIPLGETAPTVVQTSASIASRPVTATVGAEQLATQLARSGLPIYPASTAIPGTASEFGPSVIDDTATSMDNIHGLKSKSPSSSAEQLLTMFKDIKQNSHDESTKERERLHARDTVNEKLSEDIQDLVGVKDKEIGSLKMARTQDSEKQQKQLKQEEQRSQELESKCRVLVQERRTKAMEVQQTGDDLVKTNNEHKALLERFIKGQNNHRARVKEFESQLSALLETQQLASTIAAKAYDSYKLAQEKSEASLKDVTALKDSMQYQDRIIKTEDPGQARLKRIRLQQLADVQNCHKNAADMSLWHKESGEVHAEMLKVLGTPAAGKSPSSVVAGSPGHPLPRVLSNSKEEQKPAAKEL